MLTTPDPAPTGLITALLGRVRVPPSAITAAIGPSPRQMRELTEGRGLFSPYKLGRAAELARVPEAALRLAIDRMPENVETLSLREGVQADHPRLGRCEILRAGETVTVRTEKGTVIDEVHPVTFAGSDLLDRFGLTPENGPASEPDNAASETPSRPSRPPVSSGSTEGRDRPAVPDRKPVTDVPAAEPQRAPREQCAPSVDETAPIAPAQTCHAPCRPHPAGGADATAQPDLRARLRALIEQSGRSQAALSRALGKDASYLNGILNRGRRAPDDLIDRLMPLCRPHPAEQPDPHATNPAEPPRTTDLSEPEVTQPEAPDEEETVSDPSGVPEAGSSADLASPDTDTDTGKGSGAAASVEEELPADPDPPTPAPQVDPVAAEPCMIEVLIDGVCRLRVPAGFDMDAAARLIRSLSAGFPATSGARQPGPPGRP